MRKGEAESIIRELTCGRRRRHGQASLIVRFHSQLISLILEDMGDEYVSFATLTKSLSVCSCEELSETLILLWVGLHL